MASMEASQKPTAGLFEVYLRLRPQQTPLYPVLSAPQRSLTVEEAAQGHAPTYITLNPPNDNRHRAVEKFSFTRVFEEASSQLDIFENTGVIPLVEGVLGPHGRHGRDGLLATLGVTGSGKTHTILGSRSQRGLTQLALDLLFRSISENILDTTRDPSLHASIAASDPSEAQVLSAQFFLDSLYGDAAGTSRPNSRAPTPLTPMVLRPPHRDPTFHSSSLKLYPSLLGPTTGSPKSVRAVQGTPNAPPMHPKLQQIASSQDHEYGLCGTSIVSTIASPRTEKSKLPMPSYMSATAAKLNKEKPVKTETDDEKNSQFNTSFPPPTPARRLAQRPSGLPQLPDISSVSVACDLNAEYAVVVSMYEVYNDRIYDLLTPAAKVASTKEFRRRALLFKPTEASPDRKVVAGLRKIICGSVQEALMVLEAGLLERQTAGTGSNSVSSRSHGFFCVEVKKRKDEHWSWSSSTLTIVDLAGSERARDAKTQGATLAEAGKINESLMYLGQCLQMQSDMANTTKPNLVPFRRCKLTELLFSNSFPSASSTSHHNHHRPQPQKAVMIVTADPLGDFNATSQILRYSALAREITVPRVPSLTSTMFSGAPADGQRRDFFSGNHEDARKTMELAAMEIARMSEEIDGLRSSLAEETERRLEAEAHLLTMQQNFERLEDSVEERVMCVEAEVREMLCDEMEAKLLEETRRWKAQWEEERERAEGYVDAKIELLSKVNESEYSEVGRDEDKENYRPSLASKEDRDEIERENDYLRQQVLQLRQQLDNRSPTKRSKENRVLKDSAHHPVTEPQSSGTVLTSRLPKSPLSTSSRNSPRPSPTKAPRGNLLKALHTSRAPVVQRAYCSSSSDFVESPTGSDTDDEKTITGVSARTPEPKFKTSMPGAWQDSIDSSLINGLGELQMEEERKEKSDLAKKRSVRKLRKLPAKRWDYVGDDETF